MDLRVTVDEAKEPTVSFGVCSIRQRGEQLQCRAGRPAMTRKETPWSFSSCLTYLQGVKFNGLQGSFGNIFVEWRPFEHRGFYFFCACTSGLGQLRRVWFRPRRNSEVVLNFELVDTVTSDPMADASGSPESGTSFIPAEHGAWRGLSPGSETWYTGPVQLSFPVHACPCADTRRPCHQVLRRR